ncbi:hypothetical protein DTO271G3_3944 [Paecilomyces variotii]|nr:hypothetical protein DTO271G3_3944 [Paecilomyces variotii]
MPGETTGDPSAHVHEIYSIEALRSTPGRSLRIKEFLDAETDQFAREIEVMASAIGYYSIASDRFVDSVRQSVYTHLLFKCRVELVSVIETELAILDGDGLQRCSELMVEDHQRYRRRQFLVQEEDKGLETARKELPTMGDMLS